MKRLKKISILTVLVISLMFVAFGLIGTMVAQAATAPSLGAAADYAVFGKAGVTNDGSATTHIWGNVGADAINVTGLDDATQVDGVIDVGAGVEAAILTAYGELDAQAATGSLDLAGTHTVTPGVYTVGATTLNGTLTLNGAGVYIFRSSSSISAAGAAQVLLTNGACASNVFWQIPTAMTIDAGAQIVGTIITNTAAITLGDGATLQGRALSRNTQVTLIRNQITEPTCVVASSGHNYNTLTVFKQVINDNGGIAKFSDFPLFINGSPVVSGQSVSLAPGLYTVTETNLPNYKATFSGDCNANGQVNHGGLNTHNSVCAIVNDDIGAPVVVPPVPPLIDVVKVPSPLALPSGPGAVAYTYTLRNIGTVPVTDVTMVGDTCSPITLASGDTNADAKLDLDETWTYRCSTTLSETHTNTVVATGWANGLTATDVASATVVVGVPIVPPLIHVTKLPSPLTLLAGGGMVTYTEKITNPGTVALSNVILADDKCAPMEHISGDTNGDSKLDTTETWTYTCQTNLTETTVNTAIATGEANGLLARDLAIATVVVAAAVPALPVAVPALPDTGIAPEGKNIPWSIVIPAGIFAVSIFCYFIRKKQTA